MLLYKETQYQEETDVTIDIKFQEIAGKLLTNFAVDPGRRWRTGVRNTHVWIPRVCQAEFYVTFTQDHSQSFCEGGITSHVLQVKKQQQKKHCHCGLMAS